MFAGCAAPATGEGGWAPAQHVPGSAYGAEVDRACVSALKRAVYSAGIHVVDRLARDFGVEAADLL